MSLALIFYWMYQLFSIDVLKLSISLHSLLEFVLILGPKSSANGYVFTLLSLRLDGSVIRDSEIEI